MPNPTIMLKNDLTIPVVVYDAFQPDPHASSTAETFFGTLTRLATVLPGSSQQIAPIHTPISTYLVYDQQGGPIARGVTLGMAPVTFTVDQTDVDRIAATGRFLDFLTANSGNSVATNFNQLLSANDAALKVNKFFQNDAPADYRSCTFVSYMMVLASRASSGGRPEYAVYSLSRLCNSLGGTWPPGFPDIDVTNFTCRDENGTLILGGDTYLRDLVFAPDATQFIRPMLPSGLVRTELDFHYAVDAGIFGTRITFFPGSLQVVNGLRLNNPTVSLDISPLFAFAVFTAKATIPFSLFGKSFNANVSMVIDNAEAEVGVVLDGDHSSLLTPPIMKGVHFDEFGVGMGVFFEPPSYVLGVEGKFHIGDGGNIVQFDDDTFVVVCRMDGDVPDPQYIAFNVPSLSLGDLIAIFTNRSIDLGIPIKAKDLAFYWNENPMEPVALPDGSLSEAGYGFRGYLDFFGLSFYADMKLDLNGVSGRAMMAPWMVGPLRLSGDSPGVAIKVDANGNPIQNNQIATDKKTRDAIAGARSALLVERGGPWLSIDTGGSPYVGIDFAVSLFDVVNQSVKASIDSSGIHFELDYGSAISGTMVCVLSDSGFRSDFSFGIDEHVSGPSIAGYSLGSIHLQATCGVTIEVSDSKSSFQAGFDFEGASVSLGWIDLPGVGRISDLLSQIKDAVVDYVEQQAMDIFGLGDAKKLLALVMKGVIDDLAKNVPYVGQLLKFAYNLLPGDAAGLLKGAGFAVNDVASTLSTVYNCVPDDVRNILGNVGFPADQISGAISSVLHEIPDPLHYIPDIPSPF